MSRSVVVVGGGVIGAACAHFLSEADWKVTIVDRGRFAGACSHGNCGLICPSHMLPLAEPGAIKKAFKSIFDRKAAFRVRARLDPALWRWMLKFAMRCNEPCMIESGRAIGPLLWSSLELYKDLIARHGLDCEFEQRGLLFVYRDAAAFEQYGRTDALIREHFGHGARRLDANEMTALEPALTPGLAGGWLHESDGHLRPDKLMASWRRLLESRGVTIREGCKVLGLVKREGQACGIRTDDGEIAADAVVVATGAYSPALAGELGVRIPIQPGKGYSLTMPRPADAPKLPMIFTDTHVALTPMASGLRLGSTMEFGGYNETIDPVRLSILTDGARPYLREPRFEVVEEQWCGLRPMTWDSVPMIGKAGGMKNVVLAAGHNMLGLSMAPATGKLVMELLEGKTPHVNAEPYRPERF